MNKTRKSVTTSASRRRLLKQLTAAGGAAATLQALPAAWVRPMVQSTVLPTHAQMTGVAYFGTDLVNENVAENKNPGWIEKFAGAIVPVAHAKGTGSHGACATPIGDHISVIRQSPRNTRRWEGNLPVNGGIGSMSETARSPNCTVGPECSPVFARIVSTDANGVKVEINQCNRGIS